MIRVGEDERLESCDQLYVALWRETCALKEEPAPAPAPWPAP